MNIGCKALILMSVFLFVGEVIAMAETELKDAAFAAGCFWGVEELFRSEKGVHFTEVGYMGGKTANPTYEEVCSDATGHAEAVHLRYNPKEISYEKLLKIFWANHDPTTPNRQGPDVGTQYRSVIFYYTPEQQKLAQQSKENLTKSKEFPRPIVTEIVPAKGFYRAEEYHQQYLAKRGETRCHL